MADDDEPESSPEPEPVSRSEYVSYVGPNGVSGTIIAPAGWEQFSAETGALLVRIADKTGDVEIITEIGKAWRAVDKSDRAGTVKSIKSV